MATSTTGRSRPAGLARVITVVLIASGVALVLAIVLVIAGRNPLQVASALVTGALGTPRAVGETLIRAVPLLVIAVSLAPSLRARIFNLGAPGQVALGALAATLVTISLPDAPSLLVLLLAALAGVLGGVAAAVVPAILRSRYEINEIITTIAMNFLAAYLLLYLLNGPMLAEGANSPQSEPFPTSAWLPVILPDTRANLGLLFAIFIVVALMFFDRTKQGYRMRVFAANQDLSRQMGVRPRRTVFLLFLLAGAGAGFAGWLQVAGVDHRLYPSISDPIGYSGLVVALLAGAHPIGMLLGALLLGGLLQGGQSLQVGVGVPPEIVQVLVGLVLLAYAMIAAQRAVKR